MKTMVRYFLILTLSIFIAGTANAQTFFEDAQGETSIALPIGGIARLNTTASSLKLGYYYNRSDRDVVLGVDASGISNNGFAPLVSGRELSPEANINFNLGFKNVSTDDSNLSGFDYLNIRLGVGTARYTLIDTDAAFEQQISSETFTGLNVGISYNYFHNGNMIFGAFGGYERTDNTFSLNQLTVKDTSPIATDANGTVRTAESEFTAWQGQLEAVDQFSLYFDYVYIPDFFSNRAAFSVYSRSYFNDILNSTNGGFGLYLNRDGEPLKIVGGLIYEFDDLFNAGDADTSLGERGTVGIVAGYNF
jgi:hypothetical protein